MLPSSEPDRIQIACDDHRLVSNAGLILPATLAQRLGLGELANNHVDLGDARVRAMLCGARSLYAIRQWGRDQGREVSEAVGIHPGTYTRRVHPASGVHPLGPGGLRVGPGPVAAAAAPAGGGGPSH